MIPKLVRRLLSIRQSYIEKLLHSNKKTDRVRRITICLVLSQLDNEGLIEQFRFAIATRNSKLCRLLFAQLKRRKLTDIQSELLRYFSQMLLIWSEKPPGTPLSITRMSHDRPASGHREAESLDREICEFSRGDMVLIDYVFNLKYIKQNQQIQKLTEQQMANSVAIISDDFYTSYGHLYFLDCLLKALELNILSFRKVFFKKEAREKAANKILFDTYHSLFLDKGLVALDQKDSFELFLDFWPIENIGLEETDKVCKEINKSWKSENRLGYTILPQHLVDACHRRLESMLKKKINKIITVHTRSSTFKSEKYLSNSIRNLSAASILSAIDNANFDRSETVVVLLGDGFEDIKLKDYKHNHDYFIYENSPIRSEQYDLYFLQESSLHLGSISGPSHLMGLYDTPTLIIDSPFVFKQPFVNTVFLPSIYMHNETSLTQNQFINFTYPYPSMLHHLCLPNISLKRIQHNGKDLSSQLQFFINENLTSSVRTVNPSCYKKIDLTLLKLDKRWNNSCQVNILK